jgi:hypothetical protein
MVRWKIRMTATSSAGLRLRGSTCSASVPCTASNPPGPDSYAAAPACSGWGSGMTSPWCSASRTLRSSSRFSASSRMYRSFSAVCSRSSAA